MAKGIPTAMTLRRENGSSRRLGGIMKKLDKPDKLDTDDPKAQSLVKQSITILEQAKAFVIRTDLEFVRAGEFIKTIKTLRNEVAATHDPVIKHWHEKHRDALAEKKRDDRPLEEAEVLMKGRWDIYDRELKRRAREEEDRLRREAEREAEERRLEEAAQLIEEGREDDAAELLSQPVEAEVAMLPSSRPVESNGISSRPTYSAEVTDLMTLLRAIVEGRAPLQAVMADQVFLNQQARSMKEGFGYPGVKLVVGSSVTART